MTLGCDSHFKSELRRYHWNNLHMKFSVLNVDFNSSSLKLLFKETWTRGCDRVYTLDNLFLLSLSCIFYFSYFFLLFLPEFFAVLPEFFTAFCPNLGGAPSPPASTPMANEKGARSLFDVCQWLGNAFFDVFKKIFLLTFINALFYVVGVCCRPSTLIEEE